MKLYVIIASSGEYSDRSEWPVCYYGDEDKAKQHVLLATAHENILVIEQEKRFPAWNAMYEEARLLLPAPEAYLQHSTAKSRAAHAERYKEYQDFIKEQEQILPNPYKVREENPNPYCDTEPPFNPQVGISFYYSEIPMGPLE